MGKNKKNSVYNPLIGVCYISFVGNSFLTFTKCLFEGYLIYVDFLDEALKIILKKNYCLMQYENLKIYF